MNQIENIACGATEPIETQDDEFVIGAQELHDRLKLRASSARCARACFGAEDFTARCLPPGNLDVEILVDGADAGAADAGPGQLRHIRVALPPYRNTVDCTTILCHAVFVTSDRHVRLPPHVFSVETPLRQQVPT